MRNLMTQTAVLVSTLAALALNVFAEGDVSLEVDDGNLEVVAQNNSDQELMIRAGTNPGEFIVFSLDGTTTLNGSSIPVELTGVTGDVSIDLKSGFKTLILTEGDADSFVVGGDLDIKSKGNFPVVMILDTVDVAGQTSVKTKNGDDAILFSQGFHTERTRINTGKGNDVVGFGSNSQFQDELEIKTGGGDDFVIMFATTVTGETDFRTGGQNDTIGLYSSNLEFAKVNGNGGVDVLEEDLSGIGELELKSIEDEFDGGVAAMVATARFEVPAFDDMFVLFTLFELGQ